MAVLLMLVDNHDRLVTKNELLDSVWGDRFVSEWALATQIKELRRTLGDDGRRQRIVRTVHGEGYRLATPIEVVTVVDGTAIGGSSQGLTIAVLPFQCVSSDVGNEHIVSGFGHDVLSMLSKYRWFQVVTRHVAAAYADEADPVAGLRRDFGVGYVVEGHVRLGASRLRVTVTLTDTVNARCVWAERYDRSIEDIFDVLDEITDVIAANLEPEVGYAERERVRRRHPTDLRAWDLFHLAMSHFFEFTPEGNIRAQELLGRSRNLDPTFGEAHAWWAYATVLGMVYWDTEPDSGVLDVALEAAQRALELDDHNAMFHMLRGRVQLARRQYDSALSDNKRAIELNPVLSAAFCGLGDSLCYEGRYDEAMVQFERSVKLGSHDPQRWAFLSYGALALIFAHRFEEAIDWANRAVVIPNCQYWTVAHRVVALAHLGQIDAAADAAGEVRRQCPRFSIAFARQRLFYLRRPDQLDLYLSGLRLAGVPEN